MFCVNLIFHAKKRVLKGEKVAKRSPGLKVQQKFEMSKRTQELDVLNSPTLEQFPNMCDGFRRKIRGRKIINEIQFFLAFRPHSPDKGLRRND